MKAYVLHEINDFKYEEAEAPELEKDTVLVEVKAAGICGSDIPRIYRTGTYSYPLIPGHEFSGTVVSVGANVDTKWLGKGVGIFPLIPCKECGPCKKKQYEMCKKYSYLGSRTAGGFAEYVKVPVWNLIGLPDNVSFEQAAMLEPMAVAVHAIRRADIKISDRIAVCGLGTIGLFVIMFLREMGCRNIIAIGNKDFQRKFVERMGVSYKDSEGMAEGVDAFFDCVGKNDILVQGINGVLPGGKVILVGNPASDMGLDRNVYWKILRKQLTLIGTWNSSFTQEETDDWHYVLDRLQRECIHPEEMITHCFPMNELENGFELMRDKSEDYIKVMGKMSI